MQRFQQKQINGNQPGDPEKGAAAVLKMANEKDPATHLFLGSDAFKMAKEKSNAIATELELWKPVSIATDF